jgi:hypothetical protein
MVHSITNRSPEDKAGIVSPEVGGHLEALFWDDSQVVIDRFDASTRKGAGAIGPATGLLNPVDLF